MWGKKLPMDRSIPKWDIFKGHLEAPEEFIFLIIMMLTIGFGILGWHVYEIKDDTTIEETTRVRVVIEDYYTDDNHLILESKVPECKFDISLYKNYDDEIQQVLKEISNENPLYIYAVKYKETNSGKRKFEVAGIENSEGEDIISFEKMNEVQKEYDESFLPFGIMICIICVLFSLTIWLVGRYPHKFSKRIQQAIFQDGYLH